jgi:SNF2 family DNA or RNA helicase
MLVLHGGMADGCFHFWGESPSASQFKVKASRGGKAKAAATPPLPYDAGAERLASLADVLPASSAKLGEASPRVAWLPAVDGAPIASHALIAEPPEDVSAAMLSPWSVTAIALTAEQTVDLLCVCVDRETLAPGVIVGKTLSFWTTALRFAGAAVAREQFLPGICGDNGTLAARWEPVWSKSDADTAAALARGMPPACRALTGNAEAPPSLPAAEVLSAFVGSIIDHLVRTAIAPSADIPLARQRRGRSRFESVHDQWLHALQTPDGVMTGDSAELAELAEQVGDWRRPISVTADAPFRLCFRLEEPVETNGSHRVAAPAGAWYVRYLLQAARDPSLLVPVADAWQARGRAAGVLKGGGYDPRESLLASLGQAAGICPNVEGSLRNAAPAGYELDAHGAHDFLTQHAWLLEQTGFGVLLPAWWTGKGTKTRLKVRAHVRAPDMQAATGLSLEEIIKFDWQVALGDQVLTLKELEALAKLKQPLVQVRGQWVQMTSAEIEAALAFWKQKGSGQATVREIVQMALGAAKTPGGLELDGVEATGWINDFLAQLEGRAAFEEVPPPGGFQGTLRPYQVRGYSWLAFLRRWGLGACLADDMGLGKTVQALTLIQRDWLQSRSASDAESRPVLLICPMSVVGNWQKEAARFTPDLPVLVHHGLSRKKGEAFRAEASKYALVLSSYALLHRDFELLKQVPWAGVILDEAQNIKNPETKQSHAARGLSADYRIALTGTPVENHVGDLWSVMDFLNPGLLGSRAEFKRAFFYPIQFYRDETVTRQLKRLTGPFVLRRLKTDKTIIADLPDKLEMKVFCTLTKEQASLYAAVVAEAGKALEKADGIQRKGVVLATLSKLKQVCNHPAQFLGDNSTIAGRSGKLARLTEMLEEVLAEGDRALVFTQFTEMGALIQRHLQETFGHEVLFLHGGVSKHRRDRLVARFHESANGKHPSSDVPRVFILSLKAGGTGLNLTAANHVFHFDRWWNPAVENQATDRAFRIGQRRNVQVHKFLCAGTLEEKIDEMIERKQALAGSIVGSGEAWLTELSTAQLKDLFKLRESALGE